MLALLLPTHLTPATARAVDDGIVPPTTGDGYSRAPRSASALHWFAGRRMGYAIAGETFFIRSGALTRRVSIAPAERFQSVSVRQGPLQRACGIASVRGDTVHGSVNTAADAVAAPEAVALLDRLTRLAVTAAARDSSHRWREAAAQTAVVAARMRIQDAERRGVRPDATSIATVQAAAEFAAQAGPR